MGTNGDRAPGSPTKRKLRPRHLLVALLLMFVLVPAVQSVALGDGVVSGSNQPLLNSVIRFGVVAVLLVAAVTVAQAKRPWIVILLLAGVPILLELPSILASLHVAELSPEHATLLSAASALYVALALIYVVWRGLARLFTRGRVTHDTIATAVCAYILLGFAWVWLYAAAEHLNQGAFGRPTKELSDLFYFSFVTLTTLGYGDMTPKLAVVRSLAMVEAIVGQMFVAVVLARLVAMYMHAEEVDDRRSDAERQDSSADQG